MVKNFKIYSALVILGALTGCTNIPIEGETPTGVSWWLTAAFFLFWLIFSCPIVSRFLQIISGEEHSDNSEEDWEDTKTIAGISVYAFPIMFITSLILSAFLGWFAKYITSFIVGIIAGAIIRAKINPLCDRYIHKTKWLWIGQGIFAVLSLILALTV